MKQWTKEEDDLLIRHRLSGMAPRDIHEMLPYRSLGAVHTRLNVLRKRDDLTYPHGNFAWKDEALLDAVRKYRTTEALNNYRKSHEPWASTVCRRFGSWGEALKIAGMEPNDNTFYLDKPVLLYLVYLQDCDIYKIGLTQKNVELRFNGRKSVKLLDSILIDNLKDARRMERELLDILAPYSAADVPDYMQGNGSTECFEGIILEKLEDIYNLDVD